MASLDILLAEVAAVQLPSRVQTHRQAPAVWRCKPSDYEIISFSIHFARSCAHEPVRIIGWYCAGNPISLTEAYQPHSASHSASLTHISPQAQAVTCRYDVELYQRIEKLIGQKLEEFGTEQELVLVLLERVSEAQRMATMQVSSPNSGKLLQWS